MPAVQSVQLTSTGFIMTISPSADLPGVNTIELVIEKQGNTTFARILTNGVLAGSQNIQTPTAQQLEDLINAGLAGQLTVNKFGKNLPVFNAVSHVYTTDPLRLAILIINPGVPVDPNWWVEE